MGKAKARKGMERGSRTRENEGLKDGKGIAKIKKIGTEETERKGKGKGVDRHT